MKMAAGIKNNGRNRDRGWSKWKIRMVLKMLDVRFAKKHAVACLGTIQKHADSKEHKDRTEDVNTSVRLPLVAHPKGLHEAE